MGFTSGLLAGIATGAEKVISEDIRAGKLETQQLAKLRAERTIQRQDKRDETLRENLAKTQKLAAQLGEGGEAILRHYIEKGGLPYAEEATSQLLAYTKQIGQTPAEYAGVIVQDGDLPTPMQLAELATAPIKPLAPTESSARGWSKMFGYGGADAIQRKADSYVASMSSARMEPTALGTSILKDESRSALNKIPEVKTLNEQKETIIRNSLGIAKKLRTATGPERDSLIKQQEANNNQIRSMREAIGRFSNEGRFSFQSRYLKQMEEGDTTGANETMQQARLFFTATSTAKTTGNDGNFTLKLINGVEQDTADEMGYDIKNPSNKVIVDRKNNSGQFVRTVLSGPEATKEFHTRLIKKYINLKNNLTIDSRDDNAVMASKRLEDKIKRIRDLLGSSSDENNMTSDKTPIKVMGGDDFTSDAAGIAVPTVVPTAAEEAMAKVNSQASSIIGKSPMTQQPKKIIDTFSIPKLNTYFTQNPAALADYRAKYNMVKNKPLSADYNIFIQKMSSNLKLSRQEAEEIVQEFEDTSNENKV